MIGATPTKHRHTNPLKLTLINMNITHMRIYSKHVTNMSEEMQTQETGVLLEKLKQIQNLHYRSKV